MFEEDKISKVVCRFYDNLFTSTPHDGSQTVSKALTPCIYADKAPGPDGFSASFFQANWERVGPSVVQEIQAFFSTGELP